MKTPANEKSRVKSRGISALLRSYAADLRGWVVRLVTGYGIAAALMLGGILAVFGAIVVGFIALYHFVALQYGAYVGFAVLGGGLLLLGIILLLTGYAMTRRKTAPLPKPAPQFRAARQMLVGPVISRAVSMLYRNKAAKPDAPTQVMLGAAAILALGWIVATHLGSAVPDTRVRR